MTLVVAIDGPSGVGKGTLARLIADHYGLDYLDTGSLYRGVAREALEKDVPLTDSQALADLAAGLDLSRLGDAALRSEEVGKAASVVAADKAVRAALLELQRRFAAHPPGGQGAVLDGRDVGTVICPNAPVKLFLTADPQERVRRRVLQLGLEEGSDEAAAVARDLAARDARDAGRDVAPLVKAEDAHLLDTTNLDIDSTFQAAKAIIASCPSV